MNNWKVIPTIVLATVLIFGAGVFTGGMLVDYVKRARPRPVASHPVAMVPTNALTATNLAGFVAARPLRPPEILSKDFLQRLEAQLPLTKEEHDSVQKIISDGQNEMRKVVQDSRLEIREVLTPDQRIQFDDLLKRPFRKPLWATNAPPAMAFPAALAPANSP